MVSYILSTSKYMCSPLITIHSPLQPETGLPPNWEVRHSNSKNLPYYFDTTTSTSFWEPPPETDTEKLKAYMAQHHTSSSAAAAGRPNQNEGKIRVAHLLVKHRDSRRPSSWREMQITRTKDEAKAILSGHEKRIKAGEVTLGELATSESDCSSARKQGDL